VALDLPRGGLGNRRRRHPAEAQLRRIGQEIDPAFRLRAEQLLLEPSQLRLGCDQTIDELFARGLFEVFGRHTFWVLQPAPLSKCNTVQDEAKCLLGDLRCVAVTREDEASPFETLCIEDEAGAIPG